MAPSRKTSKATKASSSRKRETRAPGRTLFFGGTEHVPHEVANHNSEEEQEQSYVYESNADEYGEDDDVYAETSLATRTRQARKKAKKPAPNPLESDYDSEEKLIIDLKKQGYKDDAVARQLVVEGYAELSAKRIQARWLKLKKKEDAKEEQRLDDELSDWHIGEDEKLRVCFNAMEAKYEIELLKLKEKKWKDVASGLAESLGVKKYTAKACKERWESLEDGTALIPIELAHDKEARVALRDARFAENKRRREEQKAAVIWALGAKDRKLAERRALLEEREKERQAERARKQAERDEDERIKAEQRAGAEAKRAEQRAIQEDIKAKHREEREQRKNADAMYTYYTGKKLNGRIDHNLIKNGDEDETTYSGSDLEMQDSIFDEEDDEQDPDMPDLAGAEESSHGDSAEDMDVEGEASSSKRKEKKHATKAKKPKVTIETLANPRSIMSDLELAVVLAKRDLRPRAQHETHPQVIARLAAADAEEELPKLKKLLGAYFDRRKGTRDVLVRRLQEYDAAASDLGQEGVTALDPEFKKGYEGYRDKFAYAIGE